MNDHPPATEVRIETVPIDAHGRQIGPRERMTELLADRRADQQIGPRERMTELLADRRADIEAAIAQAADVVRGSVAKLPDGDGWQVENVQAKFAVKLAAQAGVVLARSTAEASLEVTVTVSRVPADGQ